MLVLALFALWAIQIVNEQSFVLNLSNVGIGNVDLDMAFGFSKHEEVTGLVAALAVFFAIFRLLANMTVFKPIKITWKLLLYMLQS